MSFLLVKNKPLPYQFALCARTFSQKHLTNSAAVTSVQTAQRLRNAATHGHRHADTCSGYPAAQKGSKGCEVFESVGENFQKLPTKVAAAAREVLAKVAQLHQERCEVLLATMRDTGNDDNPAKLWSRLHGASGHHSIASKKPNPLLTASKMQMGMTKSGAHSARGRRSADPTQSRRVTSG
ncbi:unnamed protein product [Durusdinium trenchii]|uniref:Uncharacterized protein n=1 Tax=Durusdinium trenchii TaxID=1381693 RepID=A0ABP0I9W7_9DINO